MLRIKSISLSSGQHRYANAGTTISGTGWHARCNGLVIPDAEVVTQFDDRSPWDELRQGRVFDQFGNKSVTNIQFMGNMCPTPEYNGRRYSSFKSNVYAEPSGSTPGWVRLVSVPPMIYSEGNTKLANGSWALLQAAPFTFFAGYEGKTSGYSFISQVSHVSYFCVGHGKYASVARISVILTAAKNTNTTLTVSWACSGSLNTALSLDSNARRNAVTATATELRNSLLAKVQRGQSVQHFEPEVANILSTLRRMLNEIWQDCVDTRTSDLDRSYASAYKLAAFGEISSPSGKEILDNLGEWYKFFTTIAASVDFTKSELSIHAREVIEEYNDFDGNLIAYASDLKKTGDTIRSLIQLKKNPGSLKNWASAWLSGRYGDRLAINDTKKLFESLERRLGARANYALARKRIAKTVTADQFTVTLSRCSTLIASNDSYSDLMTGINNLMRWDAWPTLENTWDLVPLSFVVDWALPVSDLLGQIDAAVQAPYIKPISSYIGQKRETSRVLLSESITGMLRLKTYRRATHTILNDVRPFDVNITPPSFSVVHMADGLALLVQASKRA